MKDIKKIKENLDLVKEFIEIAKPKIKAVDIARDLKVDPKTLGRWLDGENMPIQVYWDGIQKVADVMRKIKSIEK